MSATPAIYCSTCDILRGIRDWHEQRDSLLIELDPCGHTMVRSARLEWSADRAAAA